MVINIYDASPQLESTSLVENRLTESIQLVIRYRLRLSREFLADVGSMRAAMDFICGNNDASGGVL